MPGLEQEPERHDWHPVEGNREEVFGQHAAVWWQRLIDRLEPDLPPRE